MKRNILSGSMTYYPYNINRWIHCRPGHSWRLQYNNDGTRGIPLPVWMNTSTYHQDLLPRWGQRNRQVLNDKRQNDRHLLTKLSPSWSRCSLPGDGILCIWKIPGVRPPAMLIVETRCPLHEVLARQQSWITMIWVWHSDDRLAPSFSSYIVK